MGSGRWDDDVYHSTVTSRSVAGTSTFAYSDDTKAKGVSKSHSNLDSLRINKKPFGMLESRDSTEHPNSRAVVVSLDVTGSNITRAAEAQKALPNLMNLLTKYIADPQVAIWANDDPYACNADVAFQASDFESDNRIETHLTNLFLVGLGGGNDQEGYDLVFYCAANKVVMDCLDKRKKKGYLFVYADENIPSTCTKEHIKGVFGDTIQRNIKIESLIEATQEKFHIYIIWPVGAVTDKERPIKLFGEDHVLTLQHPKYMCELIGATIGANEGVLAEADVVKTLTKVGVSKSHAESITTALAPVYAARVAKVDGGAAMKASSKKGAAKL